MAVARQAGEGLNAGASTGCRSVLHRMQSSTAEHRIPVGHDEEEHGSTCLLSRLELRIRREPLGAEHTVTEKRVHGPTDVAALAKTIAGDMAQEVVLVFLLDAKNRVAGYVEAARGSIDSCPVDLRQVFRVAVICGACAIILAHNHPSGDPTPSDEDLRLTRRVASAAELLGVRFLDHVVVTADDYTSMSAHGGLK